MIKYFCDKCGKELENTNIFTVEVTPPEIRRWDDDALTGICIMCRDCLKAFQKWLKDEPQTCDDCIWSVCNYNKAFEDEPQTDCHRCKHYATDKCKECFGYELFTDSGYVTDCSWR